MNKKTKKIIKNIISFLGYKISKNMSISPLFKKNIYNTNYKKRVLISYLVEPFVKKNDFSHTNLLECQSSAEIFNELGYCVDVVYYNADISINYSKYDVIYGMGKILEKSFSYNDKQILKIFYATGCNTIYSNTETILRIRDFFEKHNRLLINSSRFVEQNQLFQTLLSDKVIVLGNKFVLDTYKMLDKNGSDRYNNLNVFFYDTYDIDLSKKDFTETKKHYLWFGSSGLIHKGLDLLIDIFSNRQDIYLHICGTSSGEKEFFDYYNPILSKSHNIINHGFVDIKSDKFKNIMQMCAFTIFPSVSEGGAASVLNTIANGGLIPIITKSTGLDIYDFGININKLDLENVENAIEKSLNFNENQLFNLAIAAKMNIRDNYTYEKYKVNLKNLIMNTLR